MERLSSRTPEQQLSPAERFELLQQRIEHAIESRSASCDGILVEVTHEMTGQPAWINLGMEVTQVRGLQTETDDVELTAGWITHFKTSNRNVATLKRSSLGGPNSDETEAVLSFLEYSTTLAEDALFGH